jgi:ADP-heptose:LPS heptosyltransferase
MWLYLLWSKIGQQLAALPLIAIAWNQARPIANGFSRLFGRPREAPRNLTLVARYLWNVQVRRKKLLVLVRRGGLGDLACILACVRGLRERHPDSWLVVIAPAGCSELASSSGLPDAVTDRDSFFSGLIRRLCPRASFYHPLLPDEYDPPRPQRLHLADEFARALGVPTNLSDIDFRAPARTRTRLARRLRNINPAGRPVVVLHPGPSWPVREWPSHRWRELAELISGSTSGIMIKIGNDLDSLDRVRPLGSIPNAIDWTNQLDVSETVALLELASVFVGIDSGPLHIAGILGVPAVGLFGPVSADLRLHPHARVTVVAGKIDCLGCHHRPTGHLHWRTSCPNDIACMREITAQEVFAAVADHLGVGDRPLAAKSRQRQRQI